MKKILLTIVAALLTISSFAQEHMTFKGIPIDGSVRSMMSKLVDQGFEDCGMENGIGAMQGLFSGSEATILIQPNQEGMVTRVVVAYDMQKCTWSIIKARYDNLVEGLTKKYGKPTEEIKEFSSVYTEGSGRELNGFFLGKNQLQTKWEVDTGAIGMMFMYNVNFPECILLVYEDKINAEIEEQQAYDDL